MSNSQHEKDIEIPNLFEFSKIIKDLLNDLINTFPDKTESIILKNNDLHNILKFQFDSSGNDFECNELIMSNMMNIFSYCKNIFPSKFFDILYQNEDIFTNEKELCFLPDINFSELYFDTTTNQTKETLWKYLQLILFSIITNIQDKESFGANEKLFEAINSDQFKDKLQETVKNMENLFSQKETSDLSNDNPFEKMFGSMNLDPSNINNLPDTDTIHDHINKLINGKLGNLAKELAEETTKDLDIDVDNLDNVNDLFKNLFKNPNKLMGIVNKISGKLDEKMKDGSLKESELLEEASEIFNNMQSMPGMGSFKDIFKSMNLDQFMPKGGKINNNAFQNMMDQNIKMSKTKERMRKKAEENKEKMKYAQNYSTDNSKDNQNLNDINSNLMSLMQQMQSQTEYIDDILKKQNINTENTPVTPRTNNNKKKPNRKKKK
tara:strand:- start:2309 stop:3616 length:1308 start_codon:yes stop_codon:yes gene_type:complete